MAEIENKTTEAFFTNLMGLCKAAAEGDERAVMALKILENQQLAVNKGLRTQIEIEHHRLILKMMASQK